MMQHSIEARVLQTWGQLTGWVSRHQPMTRLVILTVGLVFILIFMPAYIRFVFWNGLQSQSNPGKHAPGF